MFLSGYTPSQKYYPGINRISINCILYELSVDKAICCQLGAHAYRLCSE